MGLLPLEYSDCLLDSPYFRENLKAHERQLDAASADIKTITDSVMAVKVNLFWIFLTKK